MDEDRDNLRVSERDTPSDISGKLGSLYSGILDTIEVDKTRCFITATDTDAGKTLAAASLVAALRLRGLRAGYVKPVQTGVPLADDGSRPPGDAEYVAAFVAERDCGNPPVLTCESFDKPCSPHLAAVLESRRIDVDPLARRVEQFAAGLDACVAEGAGGVLVPLDGQVTMLDLMLRLNWPVLLVVPNRLGAINHALLSIAALTGAGANLAGLVLTYPTPGGDPDILTDNRHTIEYLGGARVVAEIPHLSVPADHCQAVTAWDAWLGAPEVVS